MIVFSPGATKEKLSLSHDIHTALRKASANRIPIFGGSSADYFKFEPNSQIINERVANDSIAIAFLEVEILFGLGMAHGFYPTKHRALVTRATGHVVHEFDHRPAVNVYAEILGLPVDQLKRGLPAGPSPFNQFPFGSIDVYGNSLLHVPEKVYDDGSILFAHLIGNDRVMTLMKGNHQKIIRAGVTAYEKAVLHGGLNNPAAILMLSCALRMNNEIETKEIELVKRSTGLPISGFYTYGEKGVFDDGLPVYNNQSISTLVFSDELNPVASLIHKSKKVYQEFDARLTEKASQIKSIGRINHIIQDGTDVGRLLIALTTELAALFPWAHGAFYLLTEESDTYCIASASDFEQFPKEMRASDRNPGYFYFKLESQKKDLGIMVLKQKKAARNPKEEDIVLAEIISKLTVSGLNRIEVDGHLEVRLQQLEIINQLGHELSKAISTTAQSQNIVSHIRKTLKLPFACLWLVDRTYKLLVKEAMDSASHLEHGELEKENDKRLAEWQIKHKLPLLYTGTTKSRPPIQIVQPFPYSFISLPIVYKEQLRGILNLYSNQQVKWSMQYRLIFENIDFLKAISTQIAIFIENRSLHKHATFFKEMHHRVKNNLQNIASLLRMQLRRLDSVSPEQALSDSIGRIMSIAVVHDTLAQGEIGMVDLGRLIGSISKLPDTDLKPDHVITLDINGPPILIPSREATSLSLVINELIQNAIQHGFGDKESDTGRLKIQVEKSGDEISVSVEDNGPGLGGEFDPLTDGNLGMTIIRTLVKDELKGRFEINCLNGTKATIYFPAIQRHYEIESSEKAKAPKNKGTSLSIHQKPV
jgi:two-component sensor histidine kinase